MPGPFYTAVVLSALSPAFKKLRPFCSGAAFCLNSWHSLAKTSSSQMEKECFVDPIVTTAQLAEAILKKSTPTVSGAERSMLEMSNNVHVIDCSWLRLPMFNGRDAWQEYLSVGHIPGASFIDIDEVCDTGSPYPHMLPPVEEIRSCIGQLEFMEGNEVPADAESKKTTEPYFVLYDSVGVFSAARVWWMLKTAGYQKVSVLDGGLPKWVAENRPLENQAQKIIFNSGGPTEASDKKGHSHEIGKSLVWTYEDVLELVSAKSKDGGIVHYNGGAKPLPILIDCRPRARFLGEVPEPREGIPSGSIDYSINIPFTSFLNTVAPKNEPSLSQNLKRPLEYTMLKPREKLVEIFEESGVLPLTDNTGRQRADKVVFSCGSGVSAAIGFFALHCCGVPLDTLRLYDGSWTEWKMRQMQQR